jgi:hypothetical protein
MTAIVTTTVTSPDRHIMKLSHHHHCSTFCASGSQVGRDQPAAQRTPAPHSRPRRQACLRSCYGTWWRRCISEIYGDISGVQFKCFHSRPGARGREKTSSLVMQHASSPATCAQITFRHGNKQGSTILTPGYLGREPTAMTARENVSSR